MGVGIGNAKPHAQPEYGSLDWRLAHCAPEELAGLAADAAAWERLDWRDARVPSNVQTSPFGLPADRLYQRDRIAEVEWMNDRCWIYRTEFVQPALEEDEEAVFLLKGVDYRCSVRLDGEPVLEHEGMFSPIEISLAGAAGTRRELAVVIHPFEASRDPAKEALESLKARYSVGNGWDFAPKLRSAGIWDDAGIAVRSKLRVASAYLEVKRTNRQRVDVVVRAELSETVTAGTVTVRLGDSRRCVPIVSAKELAVPLHLTGTDLWWPSGAGTPNLTTLILDLEVPGRRTVPYIVRTGIRSVERVPCVGQGPEDTPLQLRVNGRDVFLKGVNWVPADSCPADVTPEQYRAFLEAFRDAGVNFVRIWGGGLKEKDAFYEIADELGLLIMQELPLACQLLARTERFYSLLVQEASAIVRSLRHHPSVAVWSGGNEHYHYWDSVDSGTTVMEHAKPIVRSLFGIDEASNREWLAGAERYDEPSLALLDAVCARLDGTRPYQITSPLEGEGEVHGIWTWNPEIGDHRYRDFPSLYDFWLQADQHLYSEASVSSIANLATIRDVLGADEAESIPVPDRSDPIWRLHHAFGGVWDGLDDLWLDIPSTEKLFGRLERLEDLVFANQWMQGEGCRFLIEEMRRKRGRVSGIIWWGVNEPWPGLAGNALIDYYGRPKLGWSFLANAFRPTILSLRYRHCAARAVKPELWLSHDGPGTFKGRYEAEIVHVHSGERETVGGTASCGDGESVYLRTLPRSRLTEGHLLHIRLRLTDSDGREIHVNDYVFGPAEEEAPFGGEKMAVLRRLYSN